jgi:hypothetical protein
VPGQNEFAGRALPEHRERNLELRPHNFIKDLRRAKTKRSQLHRYETRPSLFQDFGRTPTVNHQCRPDAACEKPILNK